MGWGDPPRGPAAAPRAPGTIHPDPLAQLIHIHILAAVLALLSAAAARAQDAPAPEDGAGPPIRSNRFRGRTWIPEKALEAHLGLGPESRFTQRTVKEAMEKLLAWRFIESASPPEAVYVPEAGDGLSPGSAGAVDLIWTILERPLVRKVSLASRFLGRGAAFDRRELLKDLRTLAGRPLVRGDLEADREALRDRHLREGYFLCEVTAAQRTVGPGAVEVEFTVDEGPRTWIRSISIQGCREIPERVVRSSLRTRQRILFGVIARGVHDPERFAEDLEHIRLLYRAHGFLDVLVAAEPLDFSRGFSGLELSLRIEEGPRYSIEALRIEGNGPGVPQKILLDQVRTEPGGPWDGRSLEEDRRRLMRWYEEHYDRSPRIEVRAEVAQDPADRRATAVFAIDEWSHFIPERVDIGGNSRTRDRVIRSAIIVRPGEPMTAGALEESKRNIIDLGHFDPERVSVTRSMTTARTDVEIKVREKEEVGLVQVGGGASSGQGGIAYLSILHTNLDLTALPGGSHPWKDAFSGGGQSLQLEFAPGTRESFFWARFEEPRLFDTSNRLTLEGGSQIYDRDAYNEVHLGGEVGLRHFLDREHRLSARLGWVLDDVEISRIEAGSPPDVTDVQGANLLSYPTLRLAWSPRERERDFYSGPVGLQVEARGDLAAAATGSQWSFARTTVRADLYQSLSEWINSGLPGYPLSEEPSRRQVLRLGLKFGWADGFAGDDVPIFERFFLGGPRSFPGFQYRGLGPQEDGVRLGGRAYWQGLAEYSFPLLIPELRGLGLFHFGDVEADASGFSAGHIRTAAGGGLRLRLKVMGQQFPFDFYFVQALRKERGDDAQFFTFTLGIGF